MDYLLFAKLAAALKQNKNAALAVLTQVDGSSPGKEGFMIAVFEDGSTYGTVGGGAIENIVIKFAKQNLITGKSCEYDFDLADGGNTEMKCGGKNKVFISVFSSRPKLLIAGGGHIALELYKIGIQLNFSVVIFDNRPEFCNEERFPDAFELFPGDISENLKKYPVNDNCYIVIVTHGHIHDEISLRSVIQSNAAYIGMIGSKTKIPFIFENLKKHGVSDDFIKKVYSPIGLKLGGNTPAEIAVSIISEILIVKNKGEKDKFDHMKI